MEVREVEVREVREVEVVDGGWAWTGHVTGGWEVEVEGGSGRRRIW